MPNVMCIAGNPRVTPEVTRDVCLLARMMAANLYFSQIEDLMFEVIKYAGLFHDNEIFIKH
jgi:phosphoenolpyruvate carboxylase